MTESVRIKKTKRKGDSMFDLEKAIAKWRKHLNRNEALEDGAKEELENHLRDKIEFLIQVHNYF